MEFGGRSFVLVHSGLDNFIPGKPLDSYELQDFLFSRPGPDMVYYPNKILVFGHTPARLLWCLCLNTMEEFYV